jgi:hypothetical protein
MYPHLRTRFFVDALAACIALDDFDDERFLRGAKRCPEKALKYGARDGFLTMIEQMYNYGQRSQVPIRIPAENFARKRNPANRNKGAA